jgi:hypothetical protein
MPQQRSKGRAPRHKLAHGVKCIHLGDLQERKVLKIYARDCKNPVVSLYGCALYKQCVPFDMKMYQGYSFCKRCKQYDNGLPKTPTTWCEFIKKGHGKCQCISCGRIINHTTGKIKIRCK